MVKIESYKLERLPTNLIPNAKLYIKRSNESKVREYITDKDGIPYPLKDDSGGSGVASVTGTGVTGTGTNPKVDITTFLSSFSGNLLEISISDGKLLVKPITSPDSSLDVEVTNSEIQIQISSILKSKIENALQIGGDISDLVNDSGYITLAGISQKEDKSNKGIPLGYGSLDSNGKQPLSEVNDTLLGNVHWKGIYDGATIISSPDVSLVGLPLPISDSTNIGWYFVSQGSYTNGGKNYNTGDWIISNGIIWDKVDNTDAVSSVNGQTGNIVLTTDNISETGAPTNRWWTNARGIAATLTGYISGAGTITAADSILSAIQKLNGNISSLISGVSSVFGRTGAITAQSGDYSTDQVTEASNLYFTTTRVLSTLLSGLSFSTGESIVSTDTIIEAFGKIQSQINNTPQIILNDTTTSSPITATTANTIIVSYLIPANTFASGDRIDFNMNALKTGTAGASTFRVASNTTNTLVGATTIGSVSGGSASNRNYNMHRTFTFKSSTTFETILTSLTYGNDFGVGNNAPSTVTFNTAVDNYLIVSVIPSSTADSHTLTRLTMTRLKQKSTI